MKPSDVFKFGKFKGSTLEYVCKIEAGRKYLRWYIDQEPINPQYANFDKKQKESIRDYLNSIDNPEENKKVNAGLSKNLDMSVKFKTIENKLNDIESKIDVLLALGDNPSVVNEGEEQEWEE